MKINYIKLISAVTSYLYGMLYILILSTMSCRAYSYHTSRQQRALYIILFRRASSALRTMNAFPSYSDTFEFTQTCFSLIHPATLPNNPTHVSLKTPLSTLQ